MVTLQSLEKPIVGVLSAVFLAGALSGCSEPESSFEKARKPELIDRAVATSLYRCDTQSTKPQEVPYGARLRLILAHVDSVALDKLDQHGVAVCLDQRLFSAKNYGFWDKPIEGGYYAESKILSRWDNGRSPATQSWYERNILDRAGDSVEELAYKFLGTPKADNSLMGGTYNCGKACIRWEWHKATSFGDELRKNPELKTAPSAPVAPATPLLTARLQ